MIRDWKTVPDDTALIGSPFYACRAYMATFVVLEGLAVQRLTDAELAAYAESFNSPIQFEATAEIERRRSLDQ